MRMVGVLLAVPLLLGTVMGTLTCQDRFSDCWKTPAKGGLSMLVVVVVRVLQVMQRTMVRLMIPTVGDALYAVGDGAASVCRQ